MRIRRPRRWAELSGVERVDVYTRRSLPPVLWFICAITLVSALPASDGPGPTTALLAGGVVVTALGSSAMSRVVRAYPAVRPLPWRWVAALVVAGVVYVAAVALPASGVVRGAVALVLAANLAAALGGLPDSRVSAALIGTGGALAAIVGGNPVRGLAGVFVAASVVVSVRASLWLYGVVVELDAARQAQAQLAVAEERLRFSRDVHDVLGRRLSTIAVQAELAATLAERGDDRAASRMLEVRAVAHDALAEARELARGYRPIDLGHELSGARSLLRAAGIEVRLDVGTVPRAWHEAAGWVVRESTTNVLRHSAAGLVRISYGDGELRVDNDGVPPDGVAAPDGTGLEGLRERLEPLGATLVAGRSGAHWTVVAHLPGTGPLSAAAPPRNPSRESFR